MPAIYVARRPKRRGLLIPMMGNRANPSLLFPLDGVEKEELEDLIRAILAKQGITDEREVQAIVEKAEQDSEVRIKVQEARRELRRLMSIRARGISLIQSGFRRWKEAFFPTTKPYRK